MKFLNKKNNQKKVQNNKKKVKKKYKNRKIKFIKLKFQDKICLIIHN